MAKEIKNDGRVTEAEYRKRRRAEEKRNMKAFERRTDDIRINGQQFFDDMYPDIAQKARPRPSRGSRSSGQPTLNLEKETVYLSMGQLIAYLFKLITGGGRGPMIPMGVEIKEGVTPYEERMAASREMPYSSGWNRNSRRGERNPGTGERTFDIIRGSSGEPFTREFINTQTGAPIKFADVAERVTKTTYSVGSSYSSGMTQSGYASDFVNKHSYTGRRISNYIDTNGIAAKQAVQQELAVRKGPQVKGTQVQNLAVQKLINGNGKAARGA